MGRKKKKVIPEEVVEEPVIVEPTLTPVSIDDVIANKYISQDVVDVTREQLKVFLVAQARLELEKVTKATRVLDKMQDMYQNRALQYMAEHDDDTALEYLPVMIETITNCLSNSYNMISKVVGNEKIMTFQVVQNNIEVGSSHSTVLANLEDASSREKVRKAVEQILADLPEN